jgi:hypothetical protein
MSDVFFSFASKPALSREDAQALAQLVATDPTPFTAKLAAKINQALMDGDGAEDVELERDELAEIRLCLVRRSGTAAGRSRFPAAR